ncbi:MAG: hypothetical protein OXF21_04760 [bacterium]|nr:hypothetical protein [bacterium]
MSSPESIDTKQSSAEEPNAGQPDMRHLSAEIEAEADNLRQQNQEIALLELETEQIWADLSPSDNSVGSDSSVGSDNSFGLQNSFGAEGHLLDRAARAAALNPQVPIGSRRGLRSIKWAVRKLTYWYIRFLTDQFNVFASLLVQHLRNLEARLSRLEQAAGVVDEQPVPAGLGVLPDPPELAIPVVTKVASAVNAGPCLVLSGGEGALVQAIGNRGLRAYGVEQHPDRVLAGLRQQIDIRSENVLAHLVGSKDAEFGAIVLTGVVETLPLKDLIGIVNQASLKLKNSGQIIVAVANPAARSQVELELGAGLGISPATWCHLLQHAGFEAWLEPCADARITEIVMACRTAQAPTIQN